MSEDPAAPSGAFRALPSVADILLTETGRAAVCAHGHVAVVAAARHALTQARAAIRSGTRPPGLDDIAGQVAAHLAEEARSKVREVFNLTGTILHTNLGRALLAEEAIAAAILAMRGPVALEYDLETGRRGERDSLVRDLLRELTGAEDATLVNNNAAALMIVLNTLALGRETIVSRGELIEIGGAFRLPDIMAQSGTRLVEIGTTNRTHPRDYESAIRPETGLLLKVHTSNFLIQGFTASVDAATLAGLARERGVPLVNDLGSGTLTDLRRLGLEHEPTVREAVAEGADLVTFSGDKLLGGPQAGFIVGRRDLIARINKNPMKRAMRLDKIRLAAVEATLRLYRNPDALTASLPTMRHLSRSPPEMQALAERIRPALQAALGEAFLVEIADCRSQIGSGALPLATLASTALRIASCGRGDGEAPVRLAAAFRALPVPVIGRVENGALWFDLRCLDREDGFLSNLTGFSLGHDA